MDKIESEISGLKSELVDKEARIKELEQLNVMLENPVIETFQDGKYIPEIRETIMARTTEYSVSHKKVNGVIETVFANLTNKSLPSTGVKSRLLLKPKE